MVSLGGRPPDPMGVLPTHGSDGSLPALLTDQTGVFFHFSFSFLPCHRSDDPVVDMLKYPPFQHGEHSVKLVPPAHATHTLTSTTVWL